MKRKCEACGEGKTVGMTEDGMALCQLCYDACPHSAECDCPPCRDLFRLREVVVEAIASMEASDPASVRKYLRQAKKMIGGGE